MRKLTVLQSFHWKCLFACIFVFSAACQGLSGVKPLPTLVPETFSPTGTVVETKALAIPIVRATNTQAPVPAVTAAKAPTLVPSRTPTEKISAGFTNFPELTTNGPYLALLQYDLGIVPTYLLLYDASNQGRKVIRIPHASYLKGNEVYTASISPDYRWMAYFSGSGKPKSEAVVLNLLDLSTGKSEQVATVLPDDTQERSKKAENQLKTQHPELFTVQDEYTKYMDYIRWGLNYQWSPDGKKLAFGAQLDGLSVDLYVYDLYAKNIERLTSTLVPVGFFSWAQDGNSIVYQSHLQGKYQDGSSLYVVWLGQGTVQDPKPLDTVEGNGVGYYRISSDEIMYANFVAGMDWYSYGLRTVNLRTRAIHYQWRGAFMDYLFDQDSGTMWISSLAASRPLPNAEPKIKEDGFYQRSQDGRIKKLSNRLYFNMMHRWGKGLAFVANSSDGLYAVDTNGMGTQLMNGWSRAEISPDGRWILAQQPENSGWTLFDENNQTVGSYPIPGIHEFYWHPDSNGVYFNVEGDQLYYLSLHPVGEPQFVDKCNSRYCSLRFMLNGWLPQGTRLRP